MAYIPRSSLIPNEASSAIPVQMKKRRTIHAFGLLATLVFILSLLAAVGVFLYKDILDKKLEAAKVELSAASSDDKKKMIEELRIYNDKLVVAEEILKNHLAPSKIFEEIERSTKRTVQFNTFEFVHDPGFEAMLTLSGNTEEFTSVALQKMQILEESLFSEFVLQDILSSREEDPESEDGLVREGVSFKVVGIFKKERIQYGSEDALEGDSETVPGSGVLPEGGSELLETIGEQVPELIPVIPDVSVDNNVTTVTPPQP